MLEAIDIRKFIIGDDWPIRALLDRGFVQDTQSDVHYLRQLAACGLTVDLHTYASVEGWPNTAMIDVWFEEGPKTWVLWGAVVPFKLMAKALDKFLPLLEPLPAGYFANNPAHQKEVYDKLEPLVKKSMYTEAFDPKDYIMSNAWVTDDLTKMGFEHLSPNYVVKRFYARRSKTWGAVVIWFEKSAAHISVEKLLDNHYHELWSSYVKLPFVARMAEVAMEAYRGFEAFHPKSEKSQMSMMVSAVGREKLGEEYGKVFGTQDDIGSTFYNVTHQEPPVAEAMDPKQFINSESPLFEFRTKMEELGWEYRGPEKTPTIHGTTVDVDHFTTVYDGATHYSADVSSSALDCYASEFIDPEDDKRKLSAYGGGSYHELTGEETNMGTPKTEEKVWDTQEFIQDETMTPTNFAEWVDDEIKSSGPTE